MKKRIALVGGRGYVGSELLNLLAAHPELELALASSSSHAGMPIAEVASAWKGSAERFRSLSPDAVGEIDADAWVLALPNGQSTPWVARLAERDAEAPIVDLSGDHRFDLEWTYGLPELDREPLFGARRIANPGCYATGALLGLAPLAQRIRGAPVVFGVSGYSGAGRTPSPRNDPDRIRENIIPYAHAGHPHGREIGHRLGHAVRFHPHVAGFFRGIALTVSLELDGPVEVVALVERYDRHYRHEGLVEVRPEAPEIREVRESPKALVGGFSVDDRDPRRVSLVVVLDNLLKGAASQAMQNLNLALGMNERLGVGP